MDNKRSLKWFNFTKFVRVPLELFINLIVLVNVALYLNNENAVSYYIIAVFGNAIIMFVALIKLFSKKNGYFALLIFSNFIKIYVYYCVLSVFDYTRLSIILLSSVLLLWAFLEWDYFIKRSDIYSIDGKEIIENEQLVNEKPLYCKKCGVKLDPNAKFCRKCGERITEYEKM